MSTTGYIAWVCNFCKKVNQGYLVLCEECGLPRYAYIEEEDHTKVEEDD